MGYYPGDGLIGYLTEREIEITKIVRCMSENERRECIQPSDRTWWKRLFFILVSNGFGGLKRRRKGFVSQLGTVRQSKRA